MKIILLRGWRMWKENARTQKERNRRFSFTKFHNNMMLEKGQNLDIVFLINHERAFVLNNRRPHSPRKGFSRRQYMILSRSRFEWMLINRCRTLSMNSWEHPRPKHFQRSHFRVSCQGHFHWFPLKWFHLDDLECLETVSVDFSQKSMWMNIWNLSRPVKKEAKVKCALIDAHKLWTFHDVNKCYELAHVRY